MGTLRKKFHGLGNKINNALLFIGTIKKDLAKRNDPELQRSIKDCEVAEQELLAMGRDLDGVKTVTYRFVDPNKDIGEIVNKFQQDNKTVRLLFVDDEVELCRLLKRNYESRGFQVEIAATLKEAKKKIVEAVPHILILDLYLEEGMEGIDILRFAKQEQPDIKCLVVSREFDEGCLQTVKDLGAEEILRKPVTTDELEAKINGLVASIKG